LQLYYTSQLKEDLVVIGDPYRLSQIFNNLLNNAIKFTQNGRIDIAISILSNKDKTIEIDFSIKDTGIGIDKSRFASIFDPFVQASTDTTRKFGGTGLGLSICKDLVEMQNGHIAVNSEIGKGTKFNFQLPFAIGSVDMLEMEENLPEAYDALRLKHILIAEDVELNQFIAVQILETWGMKVSVANNGKEAVEMVEKEPFDLILMDIQMPEMDGIEATELIRKMPNTKIAQIPIVALTANALKGDNQRYMKAGMNDYITKPYTEAKLLSVISKYLNPSQQIDANSKGNLNASPIVSNSKETIQKENNIASAESTLKLYDLTMVQLIGKGNDGFVQKMVALFLDQVPADISKMNEQVEKQEWAQVSKLAHRMKASIESMGINSLKEPIREIETRERNSQSISNTELTGLVHFVTDTLKKVFVQLQEEFPTNKAS